MYWLSQDDVHTGTQCGRLAARSGNGPPGAIFTGLIRASVQELVGDSLLVRRPGAQITLCGFTAWTLATCRNLDAQDEQRLRMDLLGFGKNILLEACITGAQSVTETCCAQASSRTAPRFCHYDSGQQ